MLGVRPLREQRTILGIASKRFAQDRSVRITKLSACNANPPAAIRDAHNENLHSPPRSIRSPAEAVERRKN